MKSLKTKVLALTVGIVLFGCSKNNDDGDGNDPIDPNAIVSIPDANFKNALLNYNTTIDTNGDGEIQVSEAEAILELWVTNEGIADLRGLEMFINLKEFHCDSNVDLDNLDVSKNVNLTKLVVNFTSLTSLDLSKNTKLKTLDCYDCVHLESIQFPPGNGDNKIEGLNIIGTQISVLNTENFELLKYLACRRTKLTELDLSSNAMLEQLFGEENALLTNVNIKNGNLERISDVTVFDCPNLTSICVDDIAEANAKDPDRWKKDPTASYTVSCN